MIRLLPLLFVLFLAGCGFRPLYATLDEGAEGGALAQVDIIAIRGPDAARDNLRETLENRLPTATGEQRYQLEVQLREVRRAVSVNIDSSARRFNYTLIATLNYTDRETNERRRQNLQTVASFAVTSSQYASLVAREDAVRRAVLDLSRKIEADAALYAAGSAPESSDGNLFSTTARQDPLRRLEDEARIDDAQEEAERQGDNNVPPPVEIP